MRTRKVLTAVAFVRAAHRDGLLQLDLKRSRLQELQTRPTYRETAETGMTPLIPLHNRQRGQGCRSTRSWN